MTYLPLLFGTNRPHGGIHRGIHAVPGSHGARGQQHPIPGSGAHLIRRHNALSIGFHHKECLAL